MEESSDTEMASTKVIRNKRSSETEDNNLVKKSSGGEIEILKQNGTGNNPEQSFEMDPVNEKPKTIKITKITKVKTGELKSPNKKEQSTSISEQKESPSSPSAEDEFCGFDCLTLSKEEIKKKDAFLRILDQLNASCSSPKESFVKQGEAIKENGFEEDMTVDTGNVSDADSGEMEIDMEKDKDTSVLSDRSHEKTKDSDVDSVKSAGDTIHKRGISEAKATVTDKTKEAELPSTETISKGISTKVELCGTCDAVVNDAEEGICCDGDCERWFHLRCSGLTQAEYDELGLDENAKWACSKCSGMPPRVTSDPRPLLTVRKDLGQFSTPSPLLLTKKRPANREGRSPKIDIANPAFLKPFDFGWKRELVYRSTNDSQNRRQGDIYYYTPKGKKLRSLREISDHLIGTDLTQDNFTFWKEPLGIDDPEKEIIRDAKFKLVHKDPSASPAALVKKPITPKTPKIPKTPKVTPKLTATVSPLDTTGSVKVSASVTPRVVLKGKASPAAGPKFKVTPSKTTTPGQTQKIVISKDKKKKTVSDDELEMGMLPPMWDPIPKSKDKSAGVKRPLDRSEAATVSPEAKRMKSCTGVSSLPKQNFMQNVCDFEKSMLIAFQYLKVQELLRASRVCHMWYHLAFHRKLWESVRMKNSQVKDWEAFSATMRKVGTKHLDLRKILMPEKQDALKTMWNDCVKALSKVNTLVKLDLCRCTSYLFEHIAEACPQLEYLAAGTIKSGHVNLSTLGNCQNLVELKLKGQTGMDINNAAVLGNLTKLKQLSLTTIKNMNEVLKAVGQMPQLESLELGDFCFVDKSIVTESFSKLTKLKRLRLEKGQMDCPTDAILTTLSQLPTLVQLELVNFDVKIGFDTALGRCGNIKILLIIPTYVTQSATTNHLVIEGVTKLAKTLNHFVWGLTLELLRVTDLFIDQWELGQKSNAENEPNPVPMPILKKATGDSIPILKPAPKDGPKEGAALQVDVLQLGKLHKVLSALLPSTKIIILKVPFSATWRQTISNSSSQ